MKNASALILFSFFLACSPKEKAMQVLDFGAFKLTAPAGWHIVKRQGTDSYVGGLTNGSDSCWFDYGEYDVEFPNDSNHWYRLSGDTVNGFPAVISVPDSLQPGDVVMKIPGVTGGNRFTIWTPRVIDLPTILRIYKSTIFTGSDTSANPPLRNVKYFDRTNTDGKALFVASCQACHIMKGHMEGAKLQDLVAERNADWFYRFFTDKDLGASDHFHQEMKHMTRSEAVALFYYIKSQPK